MFFFIDFLRKTIGTGNICSWLQTEFEHSGYDGSLEQFAAQYVMRGEKVVAAETVSRLND